MNLETLYYIKSKIDNYLQFDSDLLFKLDSSEIRIFGGAIRDILANMEINDIDIIASPRNKIHISTLLLSNGYIKIDKFLNKDFVDIYKDINIITEPHTYMNTNFKKVQIITPSQIRVIHPNSSFYKNILIDLVQNVDISSCGLSYNGNVLFENFKNAYYHAVNRVFITNPNAEMYSDRRILERKDKLFRRGWKEIDFKTETKINRDLNINNILEIKSCLIKEYLPIDFKNKKSYEDFMIDL
jgi:phage pi2 protein 07